MILKNNFVIANSGVPQNTLGHQPFFVEGLDYAAGHIWRVHDWDEAHHDVHKLDPATGKVVWTSEQCINNHQLKAIAVDDAAAWAYVTGYSLENGQFSAVIFRILLAPRIPREERDVPFTTAGEKITVYPLGSLKVDAGLPDREEWLLKLPLWSIDVLGTSLYVSDAYGGRILRYHNVTGVLEGEISGLPKARGLKVLADGTIWVGHEWNKVTRIAPGASKTTYVLEADRVIKELAIHGNTLIVADHYKGIFKYELFNVWGGYTLISGTTATPAGSYGTKFLPGDKAGNAVRLIYGLAVLDDGSFVFTDRIGNSGRTQRENSWQQLCLDFTGSAVFHPDDPTFWIDSYRNVMRVEGTNWSFLGNGQSEPFEPPSYFGHFDRGSIGPPALLKWGDKLFYYFCAGSSVCVYRVEGTALIPASVLAHSLPNPKGAIGLPEWDSKTWYLWRWDESRGPLQESNAQILCSPGNPPDWAYRPDTISVDSAGNLYVDSYDKANVPGTYPGNTFHLASYRIKRRGFTPNGSPTYFWEDMELICDDKKAQAALGAPAEPFVALTVRADDLIYSLAYVDHPDWPKRGGAWMGGNSLFAFNPADLSVAWCKKLPFVAVGMAPVPGGKGGVFVGDIGPQGDQAGAIVYFQKDGAEGLRFGPDASKFGGGQSPEGWRTLSGAHDSRNSLAVSRDPTTGLLKLTAADNYNTRIFVYDLDDGTTGGVEPPIQTVTLEWDEPEIGNPISQYIIYEMPAKIEKGRTDEKNLKVPLGPKYAVSATNAKGEGPLSETLETNTGEDIVLPSAPRNLRLIP